QADRRIEHGDVDALRIEVFQPLPRVEAAGMELRVAHAGPDVGERPSREPDADDPEREQAAVFDVHFLLARVRLPPHLEGAVPQRRRQLALPEVGWLDHVAVGIDRLHGISFTTARRTKRTTSSARSCNVAPPRPYCRRASHGSMHSNSTTPPIDTIVPSARS